MKRYMLISMTSENDKMPEDRITDRTKILERDCRCLFILAVILAVVIGLMIICMLPCSNFKGVGLLP
jgi:type IV secretory pathway component VirB8